MIRGAIHALAPDDLALFGRALIASDDKELGAQLGQQVQQLAREAFLPSDALEEVSEATKDALGGGRVLGKVELHDELRKRVGEELMPWCKGARATTWRRCCGATAPSRPAHAWTPSAGTCSPSPAAVRLRPLPWFAFCTSTGRPPPRDFAEWAGLSMPHATRLWERVDGDLVEVSPQESAPPGC